MSIEEQLEEIKEFEHHKKEIYNRLTLLDKNTPLTKTELLHYGTVPYGIGDMEFLIVKVNDVYFDFLKLGEMYYKW